MSASLDELKSAVADLVAVAKAPPVVQGTPDSELDVLTAEIRAVVPKTPDPVVTVTPVPVVDPAAVG